jgi:phosphoglycolate phosphatase
MNLFFDLDGTLIDCRLRLFTLFTNLTRQTKLDFEAYWELKRNMHSQAWLLKNVFSYTDTEIEEFKTSWLAEVEKTEYLEMDQLFGYTKPVLEQLKAANFNLYIITARQNKAAAAHQLKKFNLLNSFKDLIVASPPETKKNAIKQQGFKLYETDFLISDTTEDIQTAKELNIKSIAVLSGIQNRASLLIAHPDYILKDISSISVISEIKEAMKTETTWK